jgi:hypothetical protein
MTVYFASPAIRHRVVDGNVIILDLRSGEYKILDEVATAMLRLALDGVDRQACVERGAVRDTQLIPPIVLRRRGQATTRQDRLRRSRTTSLNDEFSVADIGRPKALA